jgi:hypothetical protein
MTGQTTADEIAEVGNKLEVKRRNLRASSAATGRGMFDVS